jgi:hypothetical protein
MNKERRKGSDIRNKYTGLNEGKCIFMRKEALERELRKAALLFFMERKFEHRKFDIFRNGREYSIQSKKKTTNYEILKVEERETYDLLTILSSNGTYDFVCERR